MRPRFAGWASRAARVLLPIVSIYALWHLAIAFSGLPAFVIPRPEQVVRVLLTDGSFVREHLLDTLRAALLGYLFANLAGIGLAVLLNAAPALAPVVAPAAITLRNVPYVALATVLALALGDSITSKVVIVALAGFFPVMVNTSRGLRSVDPVILDRMRILDAPAWRVFWQVRLPCALPFIVAAQEIVGSGSIAVTIAAEWMISSSGLGYVINRAMAQYRGDQVYAVALLAALLSYAVYAFVHIVGRRLSWGAADAARP